MSGYVFAMGECFVCGGVFSFNPARVPSFQNQPICHPCIKYVSSERQKRGLETWIVARDAYEACEESQI